MGFLWISLFFWPGKVMKRTENDVLSYEHSFRVINPYKIKLKIKLPNLRYNLVSQLPRVTNI